VTFVKSKSNLLMERNVIDGNTVQSVPQDN
jgi:hypothetical protein